MQIPLDCAFGDIEWLGLQFFMQHFCGDFLRVARNHAQHLPLAQQGVGVQLSHSVFSGLFDSLSFYVEVPHIDSATCCRRVAALIMISIRPNMSHAARIVSAWQISNQEVV